MTTYYIIAFTLLSIAWLSWTLIVITATIEVLKHRAEQDRKNRMTGPIVSDN